MKLPGGFKLLAPGDYMMMDYHFRSTSKDVPKQLILRLSSLKAKTATPSLTPPSLPLPPSSAIDPSESVTLVDDTIDEMEQIK